MGEGEVGLLKQGLLCILSRSQRIQSWSVCVDTYMRPNLGDVDWLLSPIRALHLSSLHIFFEKMIELHWVGSSRLALVRVFHDIL